MSLLKTGRVNNYVAEILIEKLKNVRDESE